MRQTNRFIGFSLVFLLGLTFSAQALPAGVSKGASIEGITEYQLKNGMKVLLFPDESKPTVTVNVTYFVGSRHEGYGETGMAHLLEHLLFKGTPKTRNVPQALVDHGAESNGTTWFDRTNYFETMPATDKNLKWALGFEADRMVNSFVSQKDLLSEMTVVRNEYEMGETNPQRVLLQRTMAAAYQWHNYGNPTIGARSDIEKVAIENLQAFYKKYYQPDNALLVVAGRFDENKTLQWVAETFGKIPRPKRRLPQTYTDEPPQDGERWVTVRRSGGVQALTAIYHVPQGAHADFPAIDVLTMVLGDAPSGRLHKALVETKLATNVSAHNFQLRDPGVVFFGATVLPEASLDKAREALVQTIEAATSTPFSPEEVERARVGLQKDIELLLNDSSRVGLQLSEWAAMGDWRLLFIHRDRLKNVTVKDVVRVAQAYLKPSNRTLGMYVPTEKPERAEMPVAPDVATVVQDYKGKPALAKGEVFEATPQNIESRLKRLALPSGMKLVFLEKKTRGETVAVAMTLRLGAEKPLVGRRTAGEFAAKMLSRGTQKRTRAQLKDALDALGAQVGIDGNATSVNVSIEARRPQLPKVIELVAEMLRQPAFDEKEFSELKAETLARLQAQKSEPIPLAQVAMRRHLEKWDSQHPYYTPTFEEAISSVNKVSLADVKAFFNDFYGAGSSEVAVVGDFNGDELKQQLEKELGGWKAKVPYVRIPKRFFAVKAVKESLKTPDKANAVYFMGAGLAMRDTHPDYPALVLADFLMGGGFLNSRLAVRLRQQEGLSYGAGSSFRAHPLDEEAALSAYAIYAPSNQEKVETAMKEEFARVLKDGFTEEEVRKGINGILQQWQNDRSEDAGLSRTLANYLFIDRTFQFNEGLEKKVSQLNAQDVNRVFRKFVSWEAFTVIKAGDF